MMGGVFFLQHSSGNITFINNTFQNNSAQKFESNDSSSSVKESAGGAIYSFGYSTSIIYLFNNMFLGNQAVRGYFLIIFQKLNNFFFTNFINIRSRYFSFIIKYYRNQ